MSIGLLQKWLFRKQQVTSTFLYCKINKQLKALNYSQSKSVIKMNEAFLRYEKGNETFDISFRYVNPELNIDRQYNFSRRVSETVDNFLKRIDMNISKTLIKKSKRKKKNCTESIETVGKPEDNVENKKIILLRENSKIDGNIKCETILEDTSQITLQVLGLTYVIKHNYPWILSMTLPTTILADFPTYPSKFETLYTNQADSIFTWFRSNTSLPPTSADYWEKVGDGYLYIPSTSEIGCKLRLRCQPHNGEKYGPTSEVESPFVIQAGPGYCPFETRHAFTTNKLTGKNFRIISYNILADTYADSDFSRENLYPYCPAYALEIDYRKQLILKEIIGFNADIICLQEVDNKIYEYDLLPTLCTLNYNGQYTKKGSELSEGLATFYNSNRFEQLKSEFRVMNKNVEMEKFSDIWSKIQNQEAKDRFLARHTTIQAIVLKSRENPDEILVVGNTHLYFHPDADHIRLLQGYYALTYMEGLTKITKLENPDCNVSLLLCGDFNSVPECGIYQLITQKYVPANYKDWNSNSQERIENVSLSQDLSLASACGTPEYTNYTADFSGCLDYIFYQTDYLKVSQVIPMPSEEEIKLHTALPSVVFPSDHISIGADLEWISEQTDKKLSK